MIIGLLEYFIITLVISFVFKKRKIVRVWITYIVSLVIVIILLGGLFLSQDALNRDSTNGWLLFLISLGSLVLIFVLQLISNLLVIGKPFIKSRETLQSPDTLDDGFIK